MAPVITPKMLSRTLTEGGVGADVSSVLLLASG
jgi:hypothetical protein